MKRILVLLVATAMGQLVIAQVKAPAETELNKSRPPAAAEYKKQHKMDKHAKQQMMKELNLSADQKATLKEMKTANKAKKEAILNDASLTDEQKKDQLKVLHKSASKKMQGILTEEQKQKMNEFKATRKAEKQNNPGCKGVKADAPAKNQETKVEPQSN